MPETMPTSYPPPLKPTDAVVLHCETCKEFTPHTFQRTEVVARGKALIYRCGGCEHTDRRWGLLTMSAAVDA